MDQVEDMEEAFRLAEDAGKEWREEARLQERAIAKLRRSYTLEEKRAGAFACMDQFRNIERMEKRTRILDDDVMTVAEWWRFREEVIEVMRIPEGKSDVFISGFLAVIAEYIVYTQEGDVPDLSRWQPEAIMTEPEKAAYRVKFIEDIHTPA